MSEIYSREVHICRGRKIPIETVAVFVLKFCYFVSSGARAVLGKKEKMWKKAEKLICRVRVSGCGPTFQGGQTSVVAPVQFHWPEETSDKKKLSQISIQGKEGGKFPSVGSELKLGGVFIRNR